MILYLIIGAMMTLGVVFEDQDNIGLWETVLMTLFWSMVVMFLLLEIYKRQK